MFIFIEYLLVVILGYKLAKQQLGQGILWLISSGSFSSKSIVQMK